MVEEAQEQSTCAWKFVFEYRTKWDKVVETLRDKDLARIEKEFPEICRK